MRKKKEVKRVIPLSAARSSRDAHDVEWFRGRRGCSSHDPHAPSMVHHVPPKREFREMQIPLLLPLNSLSIKHHTGADLYLNLSERSLIRISDRTPGSDHVMSVTKWVRHPYANILAFTMCQTCLVWKLLFQKKHPWMGTCTFLTLKICGNPLAHVTSSGRK